MTETHTYAVTVLDTGAQRLTCPTCGRTIRVQIYPYRKIVEVPGDTSVRHRGGLADTSIEIVEGE